MVKQARSPSSSSTGCDICFGPAVYYWTTGCIERNIQVCSTLERYFLFTLYVLYTTGPELKPHPVVAARLHLVQSGRRQVLVEGKGKILCAISEMKTSIIQFRFDMN